MSTQFESGAVVESAGASVHFASSSVAANVSAPGATRASSASARTTSWVDKLTLAAIGVVVVVVTLPVLRGFGVRENERDALRMLRVLAAEPAGARRPLAAGAAALVAGDGQATLAELAERDPQIARKLEDLEMLADGRLRRHGYLFDVAVLASGEPMLRAWPWEQGQTGRSAFVWTPRRGIQGYGNADGRFSGPRCPPGFGDAQAEGWVPMRRR